MRRHGRSWMRRFVRVAVDRRLGTTLAQFLVGIRKKFPDLHARVAARLADHPTDSYAPYVPMNFTCVQGRFFVSGTPCIRNHIDTLKDFFNVRLVLTSHVFPLRCGRVLDFSGKASHTDEGFFYDLPENLLRSSDIDSGSIPLPQVSSERACDCDSDPTSSCHRIRFIHLPTLDGDTPTDPFIDLAVKEVKSLVEGGDDPTSSVLFHCASGYGRSWTTCAVVLRKAFSVDIMPDILSGPADMSDLQWKFVRGEVRESVLEKLSRFEFVFRKVPCWADFFWYPRQRYVIDNSHPLEKRKFFKIVVDGDMTEDLYELLTGILCRLMSRGAPENVPWHIEPIVKKLVLPESYSRWVRRADRFLEWFVPEFKDHILSLGKDDVLDQKRAIDFILKRCSVPELEAQMERIETDLLDDFVAEMAVVEKDLRIMLSSHFQFQDSSDLGEIWEKLLRLGDKVSIISGSHNLPKAYASSSFRDVCIMSGVSSRRKLITLTVLRRAAGPRQKRVLPKWNKLVEWCVEHDQDRQEVVVEEREERGEEKEAIAPDREGGGGGGSEGGGEVGSLSPQSQVDLTMTQALVVEWWRYFLENVDRNQIRDLLFFLVERRNTELVSLLCRNLFVDESTVESALEKFFPEKSESDGEGEGDGAEPEANEDEDTSFFDFLKEQHAYCASRRSPDEVFERYWELSVTDVSTLVESHELILKGVLLLTEDTFEEIPGLLFQLAHFPVLEYVLACGVEVGEFNAAMGADERAALLSLSIAQNVFCPFSEDGIEYASRSNKLVMVHQEEIFCTRNVARERFLRDCLQGNLDAVRQAVVEDGSLLNAVDFLNCNPLHYAAFGGSVDVVSFLLEKGCDGNHRNVSLYTPVAFAIFGFSDQTLAFLLDAGFECFMNGHRFIRVSQSLRMDASRVESILDGHKDVDDSKLLSLLLFDTRMYSCCRVMKKHQVEVRGFDPVGRELVLHSFLQADVVKRRAFLHRVSQERVTDEIRRLALEEEKEETS